MQSTYESTYSESALEDRRRSWLDRPILNTIVLNGELILFTAIVILAIFSRFYIAGARVMSHDENSHVYYSWKLYQGQGFAHDPLMHGTFQFHLLALSYFMFGDNDFTARIPAALFSIATVAFMWAYRRYLGRTGALVAAGLMLISPYILYYGRYVRNEAFVALFGVVTIWAILRYLETGKPVFMYWLTAVMVLHFTTKETSFIYMAQALLFLGLYLIYRLTSQPWIRQNQRNSFLIALMIGLLLIGAAGGAMMFAGPEGGPSATETAAPAVPGTDLSPLPGSSLTSLPVILGGLSLVAFLAAAYFAISGFGLEAIRRERAFDMLIVMSTLVLPQLSPFPVRFAGWDIPTNASEVMNLTTTNITQIAVFLIPMLLLSIVIGLWWNPREWLINAGIWYALFTIFYTTLFTNGAGFLTGMVGSLGYWLEQQSVNRGNQPSYYYWLIQVPVYEYLPALGAILAGVLALFWRRSTAVPAATARAFAIREGVLDAKDGDGALDERATLSEEYVADENDPVGVYESNEPQRAWIAPPVLPLLGFWSITSLIAYTLAGEKMPWLTVHITLPLILTAGWAIGYLIDITDWSTFRQRRGLLVLVILPVFILSLLATFGSLLGTNPPFQGKELDQLSATSTFLLSLLATLASGAGLFYLLRSWPYPQFVRVLALFIFGLLGLLTARTAIQSSYIAYDNANELLVYAHMAGGVKDALRQVEEISQRTTNGLALTVAYDNETSYPMLWYLRNYPNARFYGADPTRSLRDAPIILVGDANYGKIEPVVGQAYNQFDYIRIWWPNQDYFNLTRERVVDAITNPEIRAGLFQIWLNRDYEQYFKATGQNITLPTWSPAQRFRLYIRKDVVADLWNYGLAPSAEEIVADPYEGKAIQVTADQVIGGPGQEPGQFQRPRDLALASDGSLYVSDTENHRIQHLAADGTVLHTWGSFGDITTDQAPASTFNQPWGIALGPDGAVYVTDTWNHRIQKFTAEGEFVTMWGYFGQAEQPDAFWGPRDVAVDSQGRVYVTDTGNKRIVVFDADGQYITQFGSAGLGPGEFDEPVGLAIDSQDRLYVADTWNQRIQVFTEGEDGTFHQEREWEVVAWYGQSLDNKPYLSIDPQGHVFIVDPEGYRVLEFDENGEFVRYWGDYSTGADGFGIVGGVAAAGDGSVWVTDAGNSRLMHFTLP